MNVTHCLQLGIDIKRKCLSFNTILDNSSIGFMFVAYLHNTFFLLDT